MGLITQGVPPDTGRTGNDPDLAGIELIYSDGEPMESDWHVLNMTLLIEQIDEHLRGRDDFYVGGNMFIYFSKEQAKRRDFRGPDFFLVKDTNRLPLRNCWVVWEENGRAPNVVIELTSPSTTKEDHEAKFEVYRDQLRVPNYFIYDHTTGTLEGWKLIDGQYVAIEPDAERRLECDELGLNLGTWVGPYRRRRSNWLRFFDANGAVVPIASEAEKARAEVEKKRAKRKEREALAEKARADQNEQEALAERQRAEAEKKRADAAEAEIARLKAMLEKLPNSD